jgi:hypothetical protein
MAIEDEVDFLRRRVSRLEAMIAAQFTFGLAGPFEDSTVIAHMLKQLNQRYDYAEDDFYLFLRELLRSMSQGPAAYVSERLTSIEQTLEYLRNTERLSTSTTDLSIKQLRDTLRNSTNELGEELNSLNEEHQELRIEAHSYLAILSMGLPLNRVPIVRFLPVRVYLSNDDETQIDIISRAVDRLTNNFGFQLSDEFPEQRSSWFKKWFARTKEVATQPEVAERLAKLERALELKGLHEPQAQIDKMEAEAVATISKAVENVPNAAIQIGSILFVKLDQSVCGQCIQVRNLSQRELIELEKNQHLLSSPHTILEKLSELCKVDNGILPDQLELEDQ